MKKPKGGVVGTRPYFFLYLGQRVCQGDISCTPVDLYTMYLYYALFMYSSVKFYLKYEGYFVIQHQFHSLTASKAVTELFNVLVGWYFQCEDTIYTTKIA